MGLVVINVEILSRPVCVHVLIAVSWMPVNAVCMMLQLVADDHITSFLICSKALKAGK
jgi:hypothetical protein